MKNDQDEHISLLEILMKRLEIKKAQLNKHVGTNDTWKEIYYKEKEMKNELIGELMDIENQIAAM